MYALASMLERRINDLNISSYRTYIRDELNARNLDCLRCLDKFLTSKQPRLVFIIQKCQRAVSTKLNLKGTDFLTQEMLDGSLRLYDALPNMHAIETYEDDLNALLFVNMDRADEIFHLVEERGIVDPAVLREHLNDGPLASVPKSLWSGAL